MRLSISVILSAMAQSEATRLFVASYSGNVTTLSLTNQSDNIETDTSSLEITASSTACAGSPSWLTLDKSRDLLYCLDRGLTAENGTLNSLAIEEDGSLVSLGRIATPIGGVASVLYGDGELAVAYYTSSSVGSYNISNPLDLQTLQTMTYSTVGNHTTPPHPHHAILDPTGQFVIVPDLGSDLIRIYSINETSGFIEERESVETPFGAGPRHGEFLVTDEGKTFLFVTCELGNLLIAYQVFYDDGFGGLALVVVQETNLLLGTEGRTLQRYSAAAEVHVSPDKNFLLVSQRNDSSFSIPNPLTTITSLPTNTTNDTITSDSLLTFSINQSNGSLSLIDQSPAGGQFPRQFSVNKRGDLVAVGLQTQETVVVFRRDLVTGLLGDVVAGVEVGGSVVCVVWDE